MAFITQPRIAFLAHLSHSGNFYTQLALDVRLWVKKKPYPRPGLQPGYLLRSALAVMLLRG